jgi:hypothetical protein
MHHQAVTFTAEGFYATLLATLYDCRPAHLEAYLHQRCCFMSSKTLALKLAVLMMAALQHSPSQFNNI